jgi:protein subunit release factor A
MGKHKLFSVTKDDLDIQTFTVGGHGGCGKDTSNNGCRVIHRKSGAVGEGREHRSLTKNREDAFVKMANTKKFRRWVKLEASKAMGKPSIEEIVDKLMLPHNIKIEIKNEKGLWIECL